tara:strand:- start:370 stop:540 length:171 start_codon:yes stop_codon:yes gene_type:complete
MLLIGRGVKVTASRLIMPMTTSNAQTAEGMEDWVNDTLYQTPTDTPFATEFRRSIA